MASITELLQQVWSHYRAGQFPQAELLYRQFLSSDPDHVEAGYLCGAVCHAQGKLDEALTLYRHVLQFRPDHGEVNSNLGSVLTARGRHQEAVNHCDWITPTDANIDALDATIRDALGGLKGKGNTVIGNADPIVAARASTVQPVPGYRDIIIHAYTNIGPEECAPTFLLKTDQGMIQI
jgi:tetratricopeptide (TPR) repeat protein